jgi:L-ascorbate metabolism protein UlaG (beta-lactamase superfamily)
MPTLRYLGHSACEVSDGDTRVLIDPFLTWNPKAACAAADHSPTAILLTHAHSDHLGDTLEIARRTRCMVVAMHELAEWLGTQGIEAHGMGTGGAHQFPWGWVKLVPAWHSSSLDGPEGGLVALGSPAGILLRIGGKTLYHAGDTALFGDMALIGRHGIDLALLPIGDNYTMGPEDAFEAVRLIQPKHVVPIHYGTFPLIEQDPHLWAHRVRQEAEVHATVLEPGQSIVL